MEESEIKISSEYLGINLFELCSDEDNSKYEE